MAGGWEQIKGVLEKGRPVFFLAIVTAKGYLNRTFPD